MTKKTIGVILPAHRSRMTPDNLERSVKLKCNHRYIVFQGKADSNEEENIEEI